jgi:hypothetical protein
MALGHQKIGASCRDSRGKDRVVRLVVDCAAAVCQLGAASRHPVLSTNRAMTMRRKTKIEAIKPDQQDFDAVEKEHGALRPNARKAARAERYRLAQAAKIVRQLEEVVLVGNARTMKKKRKPRKAQK